ncbi:MAG: beta-ketoacyl-ACP synthase II [Chlorobi bacterium]|nr:beta-ketoacyl-ACP synthase II [Chlorobiota bacterium]
MAEKTIVVTGLGAITPLGNSVKEFWGNILKGVSGAGPITKFDASRLKTRFACEVKNFDPGQYLHKREIRRLDPYTWYAIAAADEALKDAGIDNPKEQLDPTRSGVIWASGIGGITSFVDEVAKWGADPDNYRFTPFFIPKVIADMSAGYLSIRYGLRGPNFATVSACASSLHALAEGIRLIREGLADFIIVGGSEAAINYPGVAGFSAMKALSERNDSPETASRPYDKDRDGFVMGEGAGALILESLEHAKKRGARIYATASGMGMTADAYHVTAPHPEGLGAAEVMSLAIQDAGISPQDVDYINTHGTSTPLGDIAEAKAIVKVFGDHAYKLNVSSTKSMHGHLLGAVGAVESIVCVLAIRDQVAPPTINHFTDDPELPPLNYTFWKPEKRRIKYALNNSFGFGGHNASVIFGEFQE